LARMAIRKGDDDAIGGSFSYRNTRDEPMTARRDQILAHVLNHGTHHRGQITAAVTAMGHPAPELDLLYHLHPGAEVAPHR